ncbi:MAG TPA: hypothetical protein VMV10_25235 [Pirellulales bacterium]|nr:hypothetical protein [Pirellulales bacterium]
MTDQPQLPANKLPANQEPLVVQLLRCQQQRPTPESHCDRSESYCDGAERREVLVNRLLDRSASVTA